MKLTVAICTYNRADALAETLTQFQQLVVPSTIDWELVLVDNNSRDATPEVCRGHAEQLPLRYVFEPLQGLSNARNRAVREADGDFILWTDDDVLVDPQWMVHYERAIRELPEASFFGGTIRPHFRVPPPAWIEHTWDLLSPVYAVLERDEDRRPFDLHFLPYGANYAVRTRVQRQYGYDNRLGRVGKGSLSGEETDVLKRMLRDGHQGYWLGTAIVHHCIEGERMTFAYVRRYFRGLGESESLAIGTATLPPTLRLLKRALASDMAFLLSRPVATPAWRVRKLHRASYAWGQLAARRAA